MGPGPVGRLFRRGWRPVLSILCLLAAWEMLALFAADRRMLPGPGPVMAELLDGIRSGQMIVAQAITLSRVAVSFVLAMLIGTALGILMGRARVIDEIGGPWLIIFLNLPALVVIVLCFIWIGLNEAAVIIAVVLNKVPNVVVQVREGTRALDPDLMAMARSFRFGRARTIRHVILPQLYPYLLAAARSGLALIWKIVLVVEVLGCSSGVGFEIGTRFQLFDVPGILSYALAFIVIVQLIELACLKPLERRLTDWRRS